MSGVLYDDWRRVVMPTVREGWMGSGHVDEAQAAEGLRTAVGVYARKAERLRRRQAELQAELEELQVELARASTTRDQLDEALREIVGEDSSARGEQGHVAAAPEVVALEAGFAPEGGTGSSQGTLPRRDVASAKQSEKNVELWREVLQVLATSGRPMRVKEIAAALGRPTKGKAGTSAVETVRSTCKRQVKHGRAVEGAGGCVRDRPWPGGRVEGGRLTDRRTEVSASPRCGEAEAAP